MSASVEAQAEELHRAAFAAEADAVAHAQPDDVAKIEEPSLEPAAETSENFEKPACTPIAGAGDLQAACDFCAICSSCCASTLQIFTLILKGYFL